MKVTETKIEVRYAETDQMGVVYHANYIIWMELGRTKLIEELGFKYADMEKAGILSPVTEINASYKKPLRYPETATIKTWIEKYDGIRVSYGYEVLNEEGELALTGYSSHVCVKADSFRPVSVRRTFPDWHEAYEKHKKKEL
ncbi:acyl-CoA thioesterase [Peribacillus sp. SCS-37]|uniref:acyl-CoA thioesterase n=1 Tax=Paraperibacillus esterisolvens TaxID=3115296 RepID=UPI003905C951